MSSREVDATEPTPVNRCDAVVVGAGFAGLYAVHLLRKQGLRVRGFEEAPSVGGTWYWNRYPGARCDIESLDYCFSFSDELQAGWTWSERYAAQPEILRYLEYTAERLDLAREFTFETRVETASFDDERERWSVTTSSGEEVEAQFVVLAVGVLSSLKPLDFVGLNDFQGETFHTARWPAEDPEFAGRRVGVIGTGSSGVQVIPKIAERAESLTVFQRTPNFSVPARNRPLEPAEIEAVKASHPERRLKRRRSRSGFVELDPLGELQAFDREERERILEERWAMGGGAQFLRAFTDVGRDTDSNAYVADFIRRKIRAVVDDPAVAETLVPTGYYLGTKRICVDTDYFETYNRPNVRLVDVRKNPVERFTRDGLTAGSEHHDLDCVVFATGFDALTGAILDIDIRGRHGRSLADAWAEGPRTLVGLAIPGFPNLFTVTGPGSPSVLGNVVSAIEQHVEWIDDCVRHMRDHGYAVVEATEEAERWWAEQARSSARGLLLENAESWYSGANIPGKPRALLPYVGGLDTFRGICDEIARGGYREFLFDRPATGPEWAAGDAVGTTRTLS